MIFVYPALVSGSVDSKIAPAIARTLEQYFLLHLQEAIANNDIRIASDWRPLKGTVSTKDGSYGPLYVLTDSRIIKGKSLLESRYNHISDTYAVDALVNQRLGDQMRIQATVDHLLSYKQPGDARSILQNKSMSEISSEDCYKINNLLTDENNVMGNKIYEIRQIIRNINVLISQLNQNVFQAQSNQLSDAKSILVAGVNDLSDRIQANKSTMGDCFDRLKNISRDPALAKAKEEREAGKFKTDKETKERELKDKELKQHETHGMYKVEPVKGVSLKPTMANMQVMVNYIAGPYEAAQRQRSPEGTFKEIAIGVKVLPLRIVNFDKIEDFILNDYFTTTFQAMWRRVSRTFLRVASQQITRLASKYFKQSEFDPRNYMNPVHANVLMASQGFINSSPFDKKSNLPSYYNFSSAIVIIDKRDLTKEDGSDFFLDITQLKKMFKMGWNSFCILDETKEEALFVSSMDGGHLHVIPYQYIFNSLGMDQVYQNVNDLRKKASPFRLSAGNISSMIQKLKRESRLLEMVRLYKKVK
jgi:hypothetical protein